VSEGGTESLKRLTWAVEQRGTLVSMRPARKSWEGEGFQPPGWPGRRSWSVCTRTRNSLSHNAKHASQRCRGVCRKHPKTRIDEAALRMVVMGGGLRAGHRSAAAMSGRGTSDWAYLAVLGTADSLANTGANEVQIRGRLAAARSEGTHPSAAV